MHRFLSLFLLTFGRFFSKRNIIILVILTGILMYGVHKGAFECEKTTEDSMEFKKIESQLFPTITNYDKYSERGVKTFFLPPPQGALFSYPVMLSGLSGKVNSIFSLDIYNNCRNRIVMKGNSRLKFRFSCIVIVLVTLAVLLLGAEPFRYREFLKVLASKWSPIKIFLSIFFSRIILIVLTFLVILGCSLVLLQVENIKFTGSDMTNILWYLIVTYLVLIFFFVIGTIFGSLKNKTVSIVGILGVWIFLVFLWPGIVDSIIEDKAEKITSSYKTDTQKLQTVNEFENKYGGFNNYTLEEAREIVAGYVKNVFPLIEAMDERQEAEIASVIQDHMDLSVMVPTTFYNSNCNELSGRGYGNYLNFSQYLRVQRGDFLLFWIDRVYYNDPKVMKNFVTGDENIFRSQGKKPANYWTGCSNTMGFIIILGIISYILFKRSLAHMSSQDLTKLGKVDIKMKAGELIVKLVKGKLLILTLYSIFSGRIKHLHKKGFQGEVFLEGMNITKKKNPKEFIYICHPDNLPGDYKVKELLKFYSRWTCQSRPERETMLAGDAIKTILDKPISQLENDEKYEVVMCLLRMSRGDFYLIDNITSGMSMNSVVEFKNHIDQLTQQGAIVVYLTTPHLLEVKNIKKGSYFEDGEAWTLLLISEQKSLRLLKE